VLVACALFFTFVVLGCDGVSDNEDSGDKPTPTPNPTPMPTPTPTPSPGGSIIEPEGTLVVIPETFEHIQDGNERHKLDY
jgi:hypothetical protein